MLDASGYVVARREATVSSKVTGRIAEVLIGLAGGIAGLAVAYLALNGLQASTLNFATFSQITFAFTVTPGLLLQGLTYSVLLGLLGGLLPSVRAARLPIVTGLREL